MEARSEPCTADAIEVLEADVTERRGDLFPPRR
jgi:hypothetical protein